MMQENLFNSILVIHIASGLISLIAGLVAILARKGQKIHRRTGKIFFISMIVISMSAIAMSIAHNSVFLFTIGIFAFFQNYFGFRAVKNKTLKPSLADWLILSVAMINGFFMISTLEIVLVAFGTISSIIAIRLLTDFIRISKGEVLSKKQWLVTHIGMMMGAYIATSTAFLVVNVKTFSPGWLLWLLPTILGVPLIAYYTKKFTGKKTKVLVPGETSG